MKQTTLKNPTAPLSSPGLHTGHVTHVVIKPAPANAGIILRRIDLSPVVDIPVLAEYVGDTSRNTTLQKDCACVSTIEHLLSALHGLSVDNAIVEIDGDEAPILDGSAIYWSKAIQAAGVVELDEERQPVVIKEIISMQGDNSGVEYMVIPCDEFRVTAIIDFKSQIIGKQVAEYRESMHDYMEQVAPCRTFVFIHEIFPLLEAGLIKGGHLDNAIVVVDPPISAEKTERLAQLIGRHASDLKVENGILNTAPHRFNNEQARHKMLDFIGDSLLIGRPVNGHFIIRCPGHKNNAAFAALLREKLGLK